MTNAPKNLEAVDLRRRSLLGGVVAAAAMTEFGLIPSAVAQTKQESQIDVHSFKIK